MKRLEYVAKLVVCLLAWSMAGCAGLQPLPQPTPAQYRAALLSCLENAGESQALPVGEGIVSCFTKPGETVVQYEQCAEQGAATLGVDAGEIVLQCAINSWIDFNPAPPSAAPKAALVAARNVRARHLRRMAGLK